MSETLNAPWIADYLINIAETYGCKLSSVPIHLRPGKKVQLLQFLTFRQFVENDCVWALVSDKHQRIPVRFSRHALDEYDKVSEGKRLTQQRCAIATIKSFKPIFQRIPTGTVGKMTASETLALNVDHVQIVGGAGEPEFGSPRTLDDHTELKEWVEGLRAGDGSGNILKQRKEKRLAQERGESSVTEMITFRERRDVWPGKQTDVRHPSPPERKAHAAPEDWRESIIKKPLRFYKRPTVSMPPPAEPKQNNGSFPFVKRTFKSGKGALDLDSSPGVAYSSPGRSERQTTPSEWPTSPGQSHIQLSPSREQLPISPPSTPPLSTPELLRQSTPIHQDDPPATPETVEQAELTSSMPPTPAQRRPRSMPLISSGSAVSPALVSTISRHKATSLPTDVFESTMSHARRVPVPTAKNTKEPYGEVLVPGSDSGGPDTQSSNNSSGKQRVAIPAGPGHVTMSQRMGSSPERAHDVHAVLETGLSQEPDKGQLDDLSRMALNGSYTDHVRGSGRNGGNQRDAVEQGLQSPEPDEPLPPSSLPIYSQVPSWDRSMVVEETAVVEETPSRVSLPASVTKRPLSTPSPPPPRAKRPRLMSRELVNRRGQVHGAASGKVFDPELLKLGIEVDLTDYDGNPPPYPLKEGMSRLNLGSPDQPLLTNTKLAEIWKSVCKYRGWGETQNGELPGSNLSEVSP